MDTTKNVLSLHGVEKSYGAGPSRAKILHNVNLEIANGEFVAVLGFSGTGKTTLLSIVAGLVAVDAGTLLLRGSPLRGPGRDRGVVFQQYSLLPWLDVTENVKLAVDAAFPEWPEQRRAAHVARYVAVVGLSHAASRLPSELSGGMRQRVAVARALALGPEVLLLDEPLGALDALTRATLQREIQGLCQREGKTVLLITNDVDEALILSDRVILLEPGPEGATLGAEFQVNMPRPRERTSLNRNPHFRELRNSIIAALTALRTRLPARSRSVESAA
jgi:nitrate/nitrite transport system ATP-binding protein